MNELLRASDVARALSIDRKTVAYFAERGAIPFVATRLGRLYYASDVETLRTVLAARTKSGPKKQDNC